MSAGDVVGMVSVLFAGLLAGEEFVIRYSVRRPLASLEYEPHVVMRQGLMATLRVLVPALYFAALLLAVTATALDGIDSGFPVRCFALLALVVWIVLRPRRTVPVNTAVAMNAPVLDWDAGRPPAVRHVDGNRAERVHTVRSWTAVFAFVLLLTGFAMTAANASSRIRLSPRSCQGLEARFGGQLSAGDGQSTTQNPCRW